MTITVYIPPDIERQLNENISNGDKDAVRYLLVDAIEPKVEELMNNKPQYTVEELQSMLDKLIDEFMSCVGPEVPPLSDYAVSRAGIYEDHL